MLVRLYKFCLTIVLVSIGACTTPQPPSLIPFDDGEYWVLGNPLVFTIRETGQRIVVPRGFVTDFATVPRIFWTFFPKHGEYTRAAIVHDYLYWQQACTREQADELFDIVMEDSEVDSTSRFTIYAAVRVWGDDAWEENAKAKEVGYFRIIPERYMGFPVKTRWEDYREFLHKMQEGREKENEFPLNSPPSYCQALQDKDEQTEPAAVPAVEDAGEETGIPTETPPVDESIPDGA